MQLRDEKTIYYYICTHVDDFKVVAKNSSIWIDRITFVFLIKEHGPRNYYLRNNYTYHSDQNMWTYCCQNYDKEAVAYVERIYRCIPKESIPMPVTDCHLELDDTPLLGIDDHRIFKCY